jgi:hypothetical protein
VLVSINFNLFKKNNKKKIYLDHKPEDPQERSRIEKAGYKVTLDGRVSGIKTKDLFYIIINFNI